MVKLLTTLATVVALMLAGKRYFPAGADVPYVPFALAVLFSTLSILSIGFIVASVVPTARFAQPVGTLLFYPMVVLSGLFFPIAVLPSYVQALARVLPVSYAVSLMRGIWRGEGWVAHAGDLAALAAVFADLRDPVSLGVQVGVTVIRTSDFQHPGSNSNKLEP